VVHGAALIDKIGAGIPVSEGFADDGWLAIALVVQIEGAIAKHGFRYYEDGKAVPASQVSFETALMFVARSPSRCRVSTGKIADLTGFFSFLGLATLLSKLIDAGPI
jgi:hypothetical protein